MAKPDADYQKLVANVCDTLAASHVTVANLNGASQLQGQLMERFGALVAPLDDDVITVAGEAVPERVAVYHRVLTQIAEMRTAQQRAVKFYVRDARASERFLDAWEKLAWHVLDSARKRGRN
jgi:hypothetical protein